MGRGCCAGIWDTIMQWLCVQIQRSHTERGLSYILEARHFFVCFSCGHACTASLLISSMPVFPPRLFFWNNDDYSTEPAVNDTCVGIQKGILAPWEETIQVFKLISHWYLKAVSASGKQTSFGRVCRVNHLLVGPNYEQNWGCHVGSILSHCSGVEFLPESFCMTRLCWWFMDLWLLSPFGKLNHKRHQLMNEAECCDVHVNTSCFTGEHWRHKKLFLSCSEPFAAIPPWDVRFGLTGTVSVVLNLLSGTAGVLCTLSLLLIVLTYRGLTPLNAQANSSVVSYFWAYKSFAWSTDHARNSFLNCVHCNAFAVL